MKKIDWIDVAGDAAFVVIAVVLWTMTYWLDEWLVALSGANFSPQTAFLAQIGISVFFGTIAAVWMAQDKSGQNKKAAKVLDGAKMFTLFMLIGGFACLLWIPLIVSMIWGKIGEMFFYSKAAALQTETCQ